MKIEGYSTIKEIEIGYFECEKCGYYNTGFDVRVEITVSKM